MASTRISRRTVALRLTALPMGFGMVGRTLGESNAAKPLAADGLTHASAAIHQEISFKAGPAKIYQALTTSKHFDAVTRLSDAIALVTAKGAKPTLIGPEVGGSSLNSCSSGTARKPNSCSTTEDSPTAKASPWPTDGTLITGSHSRNFSAPALPDEMPLRLTPRQIAHALAVEQRALLQHDLHALAAPLRQRHCDVALDRVDGVPMQRLVAGPRRRTLVVPHADRGAKGVAEKAQRMAVGAAGKPCRRATFDRCGENLVAGTPLLERAGQDVLPAIAARPARP